MAWDIEVVHINGEWTLYENNRDRDKTIRSSHLIKFRDTEWATLGKLNYQALLNQQKQLRSEIELRLSDISDVAKAYAVIRQAEKDTPSLIDNMYRVLNYIGIREESLSDGAFEYFRSSVKEDRGNLKRPYFGGHKGLEDIERDYNISIGHLTSIIDELEEIGEEVFDSEIKDYPPVLPVLRQKQDFNNGDEVVFWLSSRGPLKRALDCYPFATTAFLDDNNDYGCLVVAAEFFDHSTGYDSCWVMTRGEFDYYLSHAEYREFLCRRLGGGCIILRRILKNIAWLENHPEDKLLQLKPV